MDSTLYTVFIFIIVLFFYIHITAQYKKSEDLEIYETDFESNTALQEVCNVKQPFLFDFKTVNADFFEKINIDKLAEVAGSHDMKIKEALDYSKESSDSIDYVVLPFTSAKTLIETDSAANYFTENNDKFVEEAGIIGAFSKNDPFLKPEWSCFTKYDVMMGAKGMTTPLRYHTEYRRFISVQSGKIMVKMTPWRSAKYLYPVHDFENYEFWSPVDAWKPQKKYMHEKDKLRFVEFDVTPGYVLYIPPYWFYSIQYVEPDTMLSGFTYLTVMNCLANSPNWLRYYMQQTNIDKKETVKKTVSFDEKVKVVEIENTEDKEDIPPSI
jgi:hypothetical protein